MRVLIIEDNPDIAANLGDYLEDHGHTVDFAGDGITGLHLAVVNDFEAIVLDLALPGMDGLEVCRKLRTEAGKDTPILMLTARDRLEDKLAGFDTGADDYLVKPFELQEVEARLNVLAGRGRRRSRRELKVGDLIYNLDTLNVSRGSTEIYLNPIGLKLLHCLMESSPNVVSRSELEMEVWGEEMPDSDSLRVHIHSLRSAIDKPFGSNMIQTRHGIGYRLVEPDAVSSQA
jgi:DNA-binding response OmpR family regulator